MGVWVCVGGCTGGCMGVYVCTYGCASKASGPAFTTANVRGNLSKLCRFH